MKDINGNSIFEYEWPLEGETALFTCVMDAAVGGDRPWLIWLACESKKAKRKANAGKGSAPNGGANALSNIERSRAEALRKKFVSKCPVCYVGSIEVGAMVQHYFYAHSKAELKILRELAEKERLFIECRTGAQEEPENLTYRSLLYPDAAKLQTEENRRHIELLKKNGDGVFALRRVKFNLFFPTEPIAGLFAEEARLAGFAIGGPLFQPEYELAHGISVVRLTNIEKKNIDELTTRAIRIAATYGGELRYWECDVVRRGGPILGN